MKIYKTRFNPYRTKQTELVMKKTRQFVKIQLSENSCSTFWPLYFFPKNILAQKATVTQGTQFK